MCVPIAFFVSLLLLANLPGIGWLVFAVWLQFPVYLIHQFEEHAYPGGFKNYINTRVFKSAVADTPLNDASVFWINIPVIWGLFPLGAMLSQLSNIQYGIVLPIFGMFNATLHVITALLKREYNPGLVVSCILNFPTGIWTLWLFNQEHLLDSTWLGIALGVSFVIHLILIVYAKHKAKLGG